MSKGKKISHFMIGSGLILLVCWGVYSYFFYQIYQEAAVFATDGAQRIIQILEILNYRGPQLLPYFILFFTLVSLSLLYLMYQFLFYEKNRINSPFLGVMSTLLTLFIVGNLFNRLGLFLIALFLVALLIMISIGLTVNYLYLKQTNYEVGEVIRKAGPFKKLSDAQNFMTREMKRLEKSLISEELSINSVIYLEVTKGHYVEIFVEDDLPTIKAKGESSEEK